MKLEDLKPALEAGMTIHLEQIAVIANNPEPPTFENTIVAFIHSSPITSAHADVLQHLRCH
jgi:peptidyl-dipeptidase Dcp